MVTDLVRSSREGIGNGIELRIAAEVIKAAVILIRSILGNDFNLGATISSKFGVVVVSDDLYFLH